MQRRVSIANIPVRLTLRGGESIDSDPTSRKVQGNKTSLEPVTSVDGIPYWKPQACARKASSSAADPLEPPKKRVFSLWEALLFPENLSQQTYKEEMWKHARGERTPTIEIGPDPMDIFLFPIAFAPGKKLIICGVLGFDVL